MQTEEESWCCSSRAEQRAAERSAPLVLSGAETLSRYRETEQEGRPEAAGAKRSERNPPCKGNNDCLAFNLGLQYIHRNPSACGSSGPVSQEAMAHFFTHSTALQSLAWDMHLGLAWKMCNMRRRDPKGAKLEKLAFILPYKHQLQSVLKQQKQVCWLLRPCAVSTAALSADAQSNNKPILLKNTIKRQ